jgi:hypothetical protein
MNFMPSSPPPVEDSEDLSDEEVRGAVVTTDEQHLAKLIATELSPGHASVGKQDARYALTRHELRRKAPHIYYRAHLGCPGEPDKILVFRIDWLQRGQLYERT